MTAEGNFVSDTAEETVGEIIDSKTDGNFDGRGVEVNRVVHAAPTEETVLIKIFAEIIPFGQGDAFFQKLVAGFDFAKGEAAVADARNFFCLHGEPRVISDGRANVIVSERAKKFQRVIKNERVELVKQNVIEAQERLVKERSHEQAVVSLVALKKFLREVDNGVARFKVRKNFSFGRDEHELILAQNFSGLRKGNFFKLVELLFVTGNDDGDFGLQNFSTPNSLFN